MAVCKQVSWQFAMENVMYHTFQSGKKCQEMLVIWCPIFFLHNDQITADCYHIVSTCWECLVEAGQGQRTSSITCVNALCAQTCTRVSLSLFFFFVQLWLILRCRMLTECSTIPGGARPRARNRRAAITFFFFPALSHICPLSFDTSRYCSIISRLLFLPCSVLVLLIGDIDIYGWLKMSCRLVSERWGFLMWVKKKKKRADMHAAFLWIHHCLSLYIRDTASVKLPTIGQKKSITQVKSKCFILECHYFVSTNLPLPGPYGAQIQYLKKLKNKHDSKI